MRIRLSMNLIDLTLALGASAAVAQGRPDLVEQSLRDEAREHVSGQMLVQFRRGVPDVDKAAALGRITAALIDEIVMTHQRSDGKGDLHLVRLPFGLGVAAAMRGLQNEQAVEFAEPNWIYRHQATSNDTYYTNGSLWGMYGDASSPADPYGSQAAKAWAANKTNCGSVYVGIIDEGYMYTHDDRQAGRLWAFGCVLYECLTGKRAFRGDSITEVVAKILEADPAWGRLPVNTPAFVRSLLRRCLKKDPGLRLRDIADVRAEILDGLSEPTELTPLAQRFSLRWALLIGAAAFVIGLVSGMVVMKSFRLATSPISQPRSRPLSRQARAGPLAQRGALVASLRI